MNYYEILEISADASQQDIKNAFRKQAKKWHPDINPSNEANGRMQQINEAYEILSDLGKRKEYDKTILKKTSSHGYNTYTQSRQGSESDLDDWLKEYLKQRRKIDEIYRKYAKCISTIKWYEKQYLRVDKEVLVTKCICELKIEKWLSKECNDDKKSIEYWNIYLVKYYYIVNMLLKRMKMIIHAYI